MRIVLLLVIVTLVAACGYRQRGVDLGGCTQNASGFVDCEGISPPDPVNGVALVPGAVPTWKAIEDLTDEDRALIACQSSRM